jgi:hypothetical protein
LSLQDELGEISFERVYTWVTEPLFTLLQPNQERQPVAEMLAAETSGEFTYVPVEKDDELASDEGPHSPPPSPQTEVVVGQHAPDNSMS